MGVLDSREEASALGFGGGSVEVSGIFEEGGVQGAGSECHPSN